MCAECLAKAHAEIDCGNVSDSGDAEAAKCDHTMSFSQAAAWPGPAYQDGVALLPTISIP